MHIDRMAVENWRGLTWQMEALSPALNLICGPNESGKSRLVQALRFALFESSKGGSQHKQALKSWGDTGRPRVEVDFTLAGVRWVLEKTFLGTGCNTRLRSPRESLEGEAAEARLAQLMGVAPGGSRAVGAGDLGIWSLLWVDQGESRNAPSHNSVAQARLQDHLAAEVGEVAAGALGQRLLERARVLKESFYTARDAERGDLRSARDQVERLEAAWQDALRRHQAVMEDAQALEELRLREQRLAGQMIHAADRHREL
jgi:energy-coupling factor transporter ATP-binding protein EcfA2